MTTPHTHRQHTEATAKEPCPVCGCPGEKYDGHVCQDYEQRAAIERERETRHWTIAQWREAALAEGREDWPAYSAEVRAAADAAVDELLAEVMTW